MRKVLPREEEEEAEPRGHFLAARLARQKAFPRIYLRVDLEVTRRAGVVLRRGRVICIRRVLLGPYDESEKIHV